MEILRKNCVAIITWLFLFTPQVNYNYGQKSWDTFAFLRHFPIHTGPTPLPSPHKQCWMHVSKIFSDFQLCIGWGGQNCKKISKRMHCFKREPTNDRKIWILLYCLKDFVQDCSLSQNLLCTMVLSKQKEGVAWLSKGQLNLRFYSALTFMIFFGLTKYYKMQKDYM